MFDCGGMAFSAAKLKPLAGGPDLSDEIRFGVSRAIVALPVMQA
jgi:hypothetical protein